MDISIQDQIYIVSVSVAVVALVLLIFCITLCVSVGRLKAANKERIKKDIETGENRNSRDDEKYAYNNPSIQPDEELYQRGYLMHKGQIVPRLTSSSNGGYSSDPRKPSKPNSAYSQSSRDFIPINDIKASKDASRDFKIINPNSSVFDDDISFESQPTSNRVPITVNNGNRYIPPRPSQFNSNIMLGPSPGQNQQTDIKQEGVTYFNNRAIDY